jgi:hypothetical protein
MATEPKNKSEGYATRANVPSAAKTNNPRGTEFIKVQYSGKEQKMR